MRLSGIVSSCVDTIMCVVNMFIVNLCNVYFPCELVNLCIVNMFLVNLCSEYVPCELVISESVNNESVPSMLKNMPSSP